jgi:hypothetical protein
MAGLIGVILSWLEFERVESKEVVLRRDLDVRIRDRIGISQEGMA